MKRLIPVLILLFFFGSCTDDTPKGVIPKEKMIRVLTDIHLIDGYSSAVMPDSAAKVIPVLYQSVYARYQIDSAQFSKSLNYYSDRPEELEKMYDQVSKNLENLQKTEQKRADDLLKMQQQKLQDSLHLDSLKRNLIKPEADSAKPWKDTTAKSLKEVFRRKLRMFNLKRINATRVKKGK